MRNPTPNRDIKEFSSVENNLRQKAQTLLRLAQHQPPKPRLRVVQEDDDYNEIDQQDEEDFRRTTLRTRIRNLAPNNDINRGSSSRYTDDNDEACGG